MKMRLFFLSQGLENYGERKEYSYSRIRDCIKTLGEENEKNLSICFNAHVLGRGLQQSYTYPNTSTCSTRRDRGTRAIWGHGSACQRWQSGDHYSR
jgi:hypothetical protein